MESIAIEWKEIKMIVNCDKCGLEYEVDESRLPPQGARIKCPTCHNIFLVRPNRSPLSTVIPVLEDPEQYQSAENVSVGEPVKEDEWRVRHIGLTYSFHDLDALRDWLSARASLDDVKVAKNEDDWKELGDYPDILTTEMITKFFPLGDVPSSTSKSLNGNLSNSGLSSTLSGTFTGTLNGATLNGIKAGVTQSSADLSQSIQTKNKRQIKLEQEKAKKAQQESTKKVIVICILGGLFIIAAIIGGTYFTTGRLPFMTEPTPTSEATPEPSRPARNVPVVVDKQKNQDGDNLTDEERELRRDQERAELLRQEDEKRDKILAEARAMIDAKKWSEARATLETLNEQRPDHLETLQLLAKTYRNINLNEQAAEIEANVRRIIEEEKRQEEAAEEMVFGNE